LGKEKKDNNIMMKKATFHPEKGRGASNWPGNWSHNREAKENLP